MSFFEFARERTEEEQRLDDAYYAELERQYVEALAKCHCRPLPPDDIDVHPDCPLHGEHGLLI